jgi:hypothetical protein
MVTVLLTYGAYLAFMVYNTPPLDSLALLIGTIHPSHRFQKKT